MLRNSIIEITQFVLLGSWRWDGGVGTGGSHCVTHSGWGWLHQLWASQIAGIVCSHLGFSFFSFWSCSCSLLRCSNAFRRFKKWNMMVLPCCVHHMFILAVNFWHICACFMCLSPTLFQTLSGTRCIKLAAASCKVEYELIQFYALHLKENLIQDF